MDEKPVGIAFGIDVDFTPSLVQRGAAAVRSSKSKSSRDPADDPLRLLQIKALAWAVSAWLVRARMEAAEVIRRSESCVYPTRTPFGSGTASGSGGWLNAST